MVDLVTKRTEPGVCIFDLDGHPCFMNQAARDFCGADLSKIPPEIKKVYECTKRYIVAGYRRSEANGELTKVLINHSEECYFLRAITLNSLRDSKCCIMILIEKARSIGVNLLDAREAFHLTCRESDVVRCLLAGLTNKEIALSLGIEVNTVKDYIKKIMRKTKATTRCGILSRMISSNPYSSSSSAHKCDNQ